MRLQPIGRSLLIQIKASEKKNLLIVPMQSDEPVIARVLSVGEKVEAPIVVGDIVLLAAYAGHKMQGGTEDEPFMLVAEKEILGIMRDE